MKKCSYLIAIVLSEVLFGQQSQQLYLMHYIGESNFLNPAVQSECKWFIGLPIISSVHFNYANSGFSYKQLIKSSSNGAYIADIDRVINHLGRRTLIGAELHTTLLALGYKRNDYYFAFSAIEKINLPFTFPKDAALLLWKGNTQFEGTEAGLKGTSSYFTYYREYALGISKHKRNGSFIGIKGKLLFGKLNLSIPKANVTLYTDHDYFNLLFQGQVKMNMSAPIIIDHSDGRINSGSFDESVSIPELLLNRKNWGMAFDLGFIHQYTENITISASLLDLGFIRWRSNLNNVKAEGDFYYEGPLANNTITDNYFDDLINAFQDSMQIEVTHVSYTTFLPFKLYLAATYKLNEKIKTGVLLSAVIYQTKFVSAATISCDYNPFKNFHFIGSYSMFYRSYSNFGLGFTIGRGLAQFYAVTDNIIGMIWPLSARNLNLRFGLNINLGCQSKINNSWSGKKQRGQVECPVFYEKITREQHKAGWKKKNRR
jgi:hypothetical protein